MLKLERPSIWTSRAPFLESHRLKTALQETIITNYNYKLKHHRNPLNPYHHRQSPHDPLYR